MVRADVRSPAAAESTEFDDEFLPSEFAGVISSVTNGVVGVSSDRVHPGCKLSDGGAAGAAARTPQ
jgi:hypothetical protein